MKRTIFTIVLLTILMISCKEEKPDPICPEPVYGVECINFSCTSTSFIECSDTYVASEHDSLTWQEYRDTTLNNPPDSCECILILPAVLE